jgi:alpha/beta superfamily hydrolase
MKRLCVSLVFFIVASSVAFSQAAWMGLWEGSLALAEGSMPFNMAIVSGGALLDLPDAELYGYPSMAVQSGGSSIRLSFAFGGGVLTLTGTETAGRVEGSYRQTQDVASVQGVSSAEPPGGTFYMARSSVQPDMHSTFSFAASDGAELPGTLLEPVVAGARTAAKPPVIILHAGLGAANRDGNNYNVPGKNDSLRQLAEALAELGVASYRYDKRGSGAASWLVAREEDQSLEAWIRDLASASRALAATGRYSGVWLLGLNDGAVVAAAAANVLAGSGQSVSGLAIACASSESTLEAFGKAVAGAPQEIRAEGEALLASLAAGHRVPVISEYYAAAFRPAVQPYLIEAFSRDLETELARYSGPCLLAQGNMDLQVTLTDFLALQNARPDAQTVMPRRMNHILKDVPQDIEENYASFSNPGYPVSREFVDSVAMFTGVAPLD